MSKGLRVAEVWYQRALWIIAVVFAMFLAGLGGLIVGDLPRVTADLQRDTFVDQAAARPLDAQLAALSTRLTANRDALDQAGVLLDAARQDTRQAREAFQASASARHVTDRADEDPAVLGHARAFEAATQRERAAEAKLADLKQQGAALERERAGVSSARAALDDAAQTQFDAARHRQELRVFGARLLFTLPLLLIAGWLFARQRTSRYWPFVWGFILFALYAFFVKLVPYLPSYGGYVRYLVGLAVTIAAGQYAIRALARYLERQRREEQQPDAARRGAIDFVSAYAQIDKKVCPGCERPLDTTDPQRNFCPHCGIGVFNQCGQCHARKNAFSRYCPACGAQAALETAKQV